MARKKRMLVSITPEFDKVLADLAAESGAAKASIAAELLEQSIPTLVEMTRFMRIAKTKQAEAFEMLNEVVMTTIGGATQLGLELTDVKTGVKTGLRRYPERVSKKTEKKKSED